MHKPYGPYEKYLKRPIDLLCGLAAVLVFVGYIYFLLFWDSFLCEEIHFLPRNDPEKRKNI